MSDQQGKDQKPKEKLPIWNCGVVRDEDLKYPEKEGITVGEIFVLNCKGDPAAFEKKEWVIELPEKMERTLVLLGVKSYAPDQAELQVTSSRAGQVALDKAVLTDSVHRQELKVAKFAVETVVEPPKDGKPPEPFGPVPPQAISLPLWFWIIIGFVGAGVLGWIVVKIQRMMQKKRVTTELSKHATALTPYNQFNKDLRTLMRDYIFSKDEPWPKDRVKEFVSILNRYFRTFILREFTVPALEWSSKAVVKDIKSRQRKKLQKVTLEGLRLTLREFDKAIERIERVDSTDCQQLLDISRKTAQSIAKDKRSDH